MLKEHYPDLVVGPLQGSRFVVQAPADFDWAAARTLLSQENVAPIGVLHLDLVWRNLDDLRADEHDRRQRLDQEQHEPLREAWAAFAAASGQALAERDLMRAVRQVVAARREAYDPRLEELVRVVTAVEALWRGRMGERRFEAWLRGPIDGRSAAAAGAGEDPAATDGAERPRQALAPPQQGPLVGATDWYAWRDASSLAWQRVHDLAKAVGAHAGRIGRRAGENGEAMAELARRMQRVVAASRPLAVDGR